MLDADEILKSQAVVQSLGQPLTEDTTERIIEQQSAMILSSGCRQGGHDEIRFAALNMALTQRRPDEAVIHHSDQGTQYTSIAFGKRCRAMNVRPSMGSVGDCYDNAMCESFFATLECELIERCTFRTQAEARLEIFQFIEGWYNRHRRHSSLGYLSPQAYERKSLNNTPVQ